MKKIIAGVITLVIGGTIFTISKADVARNFSKDTGLSQQESQQYIENIKEDDLVSFDKLGADLNSEGQEILNLATKIDCVNYNYKWETNTLTCEDGKLQIRNIANDEITLGNAYIRLSSKSATKSDISSAISFIDKLNADFRSEVVTSLLDSGTISETTKTNSYNKALLQSALESK